MHIYEPVPYAPALIAKESVPYEHAQGCLIAIRCFLYDCLGGRDAIEPYTEEWIHGTIERIKHTFKETADGFIEPLFLCGRQPFYFELRHYKKGEDCTAEEAGKMETVLYALLHQVFREAVGSDFDQYQRRG